MRSFDWDAPAKLFFWPAVDGADEDAVYPTLADALKAAGEGDITTAWIITQNGDIVSPRMVAALREEGGPRRRSASPRSLFSWARAA